MVITERRLVVFIGVIAILHREIDIERVVMSTSDFPTRLAVIGRIV